MIILKYSEQLQILNGGKSFIIVGFNKEYMKRYIEKCI